MSPAPREPTRRLFFALWPGAQERAALMTATAAARSAAGGRAIPAADLHVTLAFLGSVAEARLEQLSDLARAVAATWSAPVPGVLTFGQVAHWQRPQLLCAVGRAEGSTAAVLAAALKDATQAAGFSPDLRPFRAHVTVARKVVRAAPLTTIEKVSWHWQAFALIQSRPLAAGSVYSVVESHLLVKAEKVREKR